MQYETKCCFNVILRLYWTFTFCSGHATVAVNFNVQIKKIQCLMHSQNKYVCWRAEQSFGNCFEHSTNALNIISKYTEKPSRDIFSKTRYINSTGIDLTRSSRFEHKVLWLELEVRTMSLAVLSHLALFVFNLIVHCYGAVILTESSIFSQFKTLQALPKHHIIPYRYQLSST